MEKNSNHIPGGYIQIPLAEKNITTELSGDFTLPDYQPEIKRLLRVTAAILPPSKYIGNREAEFEGNIDYYVFYTGSDNEVYCAPLTSDYKVNVPFDFNDEEGIVSMNATVSISPDMISGRVTSPRKLNIKCRLRTSAVILGDLPIEDGFSNSSADLELLNGLIETTRIFSGVGDKLHLTDEMISDGSSEELRIISADGRVLMNEVTAAENCVNCRGELYLKLLICREGGTEPFAVTRKIPFSQTVGAEGSYIGCTASGKGTVCDMSITVEDNRISIDVGMIVEVEGCKSENVCFVKDMFSTAFHTNCEYKNWSYLKNGSSFSGNFTLSDSMSLDELGIAPGAKLIDVGGIALPEDYTVDAERCRIVGKTRFWMLMQKDGEYSVAECELPFKYDIKAVDGAKKLLGEASIVSVRARVDGERIGIDAEVGIRGRVWSEDTMKMPISVVFNEERRRSKGEVIICYPSDDDSVWSVAKRYGVNVGQLASKNEIDILTQADDCACLKGLNNLVI